MNIRCAHHESAQINIPNTHTHTKWYRLEHMPTCSGQTPVISDHPHIIGGHNRSTCPFYKKTLHFEYINKPHCFFKQFLRTVQHCQFSFIARDAVFFFLRGFTYAVESGPDEISQNLYTPSLKGGFLPLYTLQPADCNVVPLLRSKVHYPRSTAATSADPPLLLSSKYLLSS